MKYRSIGNSKYFVKLVHHCSRYSLVKFVALKSDVADTIFEMVQEFESLFESRVRKMTCIKGNKAK